MRKLIAMLMALMMLFGIGAACAEGEKTGEETPAVGGPAVGSWAAAENTEITPDELAVFDKAIEGLMGVKYEPVLLLGTQVVAGTNYAFLCKGTVVYPDALPYWYIRARWFIRTRCLTGTFCTFIRMCRATSKCWTSRTSSWPFRP